MFTSRPGAWLLAAAACGGLATALYAFLSAGTGVDWTLGAFLASVAAAALIPLSLLLVATRRRTAPRLLARGLALVDIFGTGLAAYFLDAWALLALMALAFAGWLLDWSPPAATRPLASG